MGFYRQEHWSGAPVPYPGDLPSPGIEPASLMAPALAGRFFNTSATWEAQTVKRSFNFFFFNFIFIFKLGLLKDLYFKG